MRDADRLDAALDAVGRQLALAWHVEIAARGLAGDLTGPQLDALGRVLRACAVPDAGAPPRRVPPPLYLDAVSGILEAAPNPRAAVEELLALLDADPALLGAVAGRWADYLAAWSIAEAERLQALGAANGAQRSR